MAFEFDLESSYDLTTQSPAVLGASLTNMVYVGGPFTYAVAVAFDPKIGITHSQVLPSIANSGVSVDPSTLYYHLFKNPTAPLQNIVLADPWILSASKRNNKTVTATIVLTSGGLINIQALRSLLSGYPSIVESFTISDPV